MAAPRPAIVTDWALSAATANEAPTRGARHSRLRLGRPVPTRPGAPARFTTSVAQQANVWASQMPELETEDLRGSA